ncbi:MAG: hypothetical protein SGJ02_02415 [bacterium]|nr:hypothetical protein [bacterium]
MSGVLAKDFMDPCSIYQIGVAPNGIDILNRILGVDFSSAYKKREIVNLNGLEIPFICKADLIAAKLAAGRPQDLVDAGSLAKVKN